MPKTEKPRPRAMVQFRACASTYSSLNKIGLAYGLHRGIAAKYLAALAINGLDYRYFTLINSMAAASGDNFVNCCNHVGSSLQALGLNDSIDLPEKKRSSAIYKIFNDYVSSYEKKTP